MVHVIVEDKRDHGGTLWFSVLVDVAFSVPVQSEFRLMLPLSRHGGDLVMLSICSTSHENGGSRSRTTNTSFGVQLCALAITDTGTTSFILST